MQVSESMQVSDTCWAGESMQVSDTTGVKGMGSHDGHGLNEMEVSFRSLQKYLPWFNKVHVLVNGVDVSKPSAVAAHVCM